MIYSGNTDIFTRLDRIEALLSNLIAVRKEKESYSTAELAEVSGKSDFTVREWCRNGRVRATKRDSGRGHSKEWSVSHEELTRIQNHGLLPVRRFFD